MEGTPEGDFMKFMLIVGNIYNRILLGLTIQKNDVAIFLLTFGDLYMRSKVTAVIIVRSMSTLVSKCAKYHKEHECDIYFVIRPFNFLLYANKLILCINLPRFRIVRPRGLRTLFCFYFDGFQSI